MERDEFKNKFDPEPSEIARDEYVKRVERENTRLKKQVGTDENLFQYIKDGLVSCPPSKLVPYPKPKLAHSLARCTKEAE